MIATDEDALICDLAETYHVFDYRSLPVKTVAAFCVGLREDSRIKRKISGRGCSTAELLMAMAVDRLSMLIWMRTEDAQKGKNKPQFIAEKLLGSDAAKGGEYKSYASAEAFKAAWSHITGGSQ